MNAKETKTWRKANHYTQERLAYELGVSVRTIWRIEDGGKPSRLLGVAWERFVETQAAKENPS